MKLSEYLTESILSKRTGQYRHSRGEQVTEENIGVGMRVQYKDDLSGYPKQTGYPVVGNLSIYPGMQRYLGQVTTVVNVDKDPDGNTVVEVKGNSYWWPIEIFVMA